MAKIKQFVTLREKKLSNGNVSLYLDVYYNGKRLYDFLKMYPKQNPRTPEERTNNNETYALAEEIRSTKESQMKYSEHGLVSPKLRKINFLDYCDKFLTEYQNKDERIVKYCIVHFKAFINGKGIQQLLPNHLTEELVIQFKKYLDNTVHGETSYNYFTKFKKICKTAHKEKILKENPAIDVLNRRKEGLKKDILFFDEIQKLANTQCGNPEVKRAFLLSLNTGLRFVDIKALTWGQVYKNQIIIKGQKKTGESVCIDLNNNAKRIIGEQKIDGNELVFKLPTLFSCLGTLKAWTKKAEINKNITWHSARHSFAVGLLNEGKANIKTVSSLLGHASLQYTEKYTRVVNSLKEQAVNNLPDLILS